MPRCAWLFGVARNVVSAEHRRASRERAANARIQGRRLLDDDDIARLQERIDAEAAGRELLRAVAFLPDGERAVLETRRRRRADGRRGGRGPRHPAGPAASGLAVVAAVSPPPPSSRSSTGGDRRRRLRRAAARRRQRAVTINGLRDADGLERALRDEGVRAVVDYLPAGATCAPGRSRPRQPARAAGRSQLRQGADGSVSFTIDRGTVAPGATLVIESSGGDGGPTTMSIAVADGDVGPCRS